MKNLSWLSRLLNPQPSLAMFLGMLVAMFLAAACIAVAQNPAAPASESKCTTRPPGQSAQNLPGGAPGSDEPKQAGAPPGLRTIVDVAAAG